eukprot:scaffold3505_cov170-Amphora_coffeaeformis.AAC.15
MGLMMKDSYISGEIFYSLLYCCALLFFPTPSGNSMLGFFVALAKIEVGIAYACWSALGTLIVSTVEIDLHPRLLLRDVDDERKALGVLRFGQRSCGLIVNGLNTPLNKTGAPLVDRRDLRGMPVVCASRHGHHFHSI